MRRDRFSRRGAEAQGWWDPEVVRSLIESNAAAVAFVVVPPTPSRHRGFARILPPELSLTVPAPPGIRSVGSACCSDSVSPVLPRPSRLPPR
jgi:hypothetical protein